MCANGRKEERFYRGSVERSAQQTDASSRAWQTGVSDSASQDVGAWTRLHQHHDLKRQR